MAARLVGMPDWAFDLNDGTVNAGGTLTFNEPGTSTQKTIFTSTDTTGSTHTNPHTLDSSGRPTAGIYAEGLYDVIVKDSAGATLRTFLDWGDNDSAIATDLNNLILNASFETDSNADGTPDNWTLAPDTNITIARSTSSPGHGAACLLFTVTGSGSANAISTAFELSNLDTILGSMKVISSVAGLEIIVRLRILDSAQSLLSQPIIFSSTNNSTSWAEDVFAGLTVGDHEVTGRFGRLALIVNDNGNTGTVCFDGIELYTEQQVAAPIIPVGLVISRDSGDTSHDLNITKGSCKADDGLFDLILDSEITKQIDVAFAAGDDAGGAEAGFAIPSEDIFFIWLIGDSTGTKRTDVFVSNSATSPTVPTGYDKKRRIFAWVADASNNLLAGKHDGLDKFYALGEITDLTDGSLTTNVFETGTFICPPNGEYFFSCFLTTPTTDKWEEAFVTTSPTGASFTLRQDGMDLTTAGQVIDDQGFRGSETCDASSQFDYKVTFQNTADITITFGFIGFRDIGRNLI